MAPDFALLTLLAEIMLITSTSKTFKGYVHRKANATSFFMIILKTIPSYFYSYNTTDSYNVLSHSLLKWEGLSLIFWTVLEFSYLCDFAPIICPIST